MIRNINKDITSLKRKSVVASKMDIQVGKDLKDTLFANRDRCVGMAANMIGVHKNIIAVSFINQIIVMYNPKIIKKEIPYKTKEGCLSLLGERETIRYQKIKVEYQDESFIKKTIDLSGFVAQIVQHECDHLEGIII